MLQIFRKFVSCLEPKHLKGLRLLVLISAVAAVVEVLSLATLYPIILVGANGAPDTGLIRDIPEVFGLTDNRRIGMFWAAITLIAVLIGLIVRSFATWYQMNFTEDIRRSFSTRLFQCYLARPYSFYIERNSTDLAKNVLSEVDLVVNLAVLGWVQCISASATLIAVTALLFGLSPVATFVTIGSGAVLYVTIYYGLSRLSTQIRAQRFAANERRHKIVSESLAMLREIKTRNAERHQIDAFEAQARIVSASFAKNGLIGNVPRYLIETLLFGGVAIAMLVMFALNGDAEAAFASILPTLSTMVAAGIRVLPAAQSIYRGLNSARQVAPSVEAIGAELVLAESNTPTGPISRRGLTASITLSGVTFRHKGRTKPSLSDVNLTIEKGSVVGIWGQTGSGKSTLINLLMGLLEPSEGQIEIDGSPLMDADRKSWQLNIGYVPQEIILADDTVARNIAFGFEDAEIDHEKLRYASRLACVDDVIDGLPFGYDTIVGQGGKTLSGGQRQRICIARAFYTDPEVIVFDEATSALDFATEQMLIKSLKSVSAEKTVIMVTHRENTLDACDRVIWLQDGVLA